jgi:hypothetical protein
MRARTVLFLFHLKVGARLALRALAPLLAVVVFLFYVLRPEFAIELARILFLEGSLLESGLIGTALLMGLGRIVAPRIGSGSGGWARSLPVGGGAQRLSSVFAVLLAEAPLLAILGGLAWAVTAPEPMNAAAYITRLVAHLVLVAPHIIGLIIGAAAAGLACLPNPASPLMRFFQFLACFLSFSGHAALLGVSAALLVLSMVFPGRSAASRKSFGPRSDLPYAAFFPGLSLRAVRGRIILAYVPPAIILGAAWLFLTNNELASHTAFALSLFGLALGLTGFVGTAADILAARRPAWPWLRSLPRAAAARVKDDALFLAMLALPLLGGLALLGRPAWEAVYLVGPLAWLAIRGTGAMREAGDRPFGALGRVAIEGTILSLVLALLPWTSFLLAASTPAAFLFARNAERRLKPTRWAERHHSNAGDPLSWSAS